MRRDTRWSALYVRGAKRQRGVRKSDAIAMFQQLSSKPRAIERIAPSPKLVRIKLHGVPMAFKLMYLSNLAWYAVEFAGGMIRCCHRERICRIEDKVDICVLSEQPPAVPVDMLQLSRRLRLGQNLALVTLRPHGPLRTHRRK